MVCAKLGERNVGILAGAGGTPCEGRTMSTTRGDYGCGEIEACAVCSRI